MLGKEVHEMLAHPFFGCQSNVFSAQKVENMGLAILFLNFYFVSGRFNRNILLTLYPKSLFANNGSAKILILKEINEELWQKRSRRYLSIA
jgi:hypothetical protein